MRRNDLIEWKKKYDIARHHAWAGATLLSVLLAIRIVLLTYQVTTMVDPLFFLLVLVLTGYIMISLWFTYKYRSALTVEEKKTPESIQFEKGGAIEKIEKNLAKIKKKKLKAEIKTAKKRKK